MLASSSRSVPRLVFVTRETSVAASETSVLTTVLPALFACGSQEPMFIPTIESCEPVAAVVRKVGTVPVRVRRPVWVAVERSVSTKDSLGPLSWSIPCPSVEDPAASFSHRVDAVAVGVEGDQPTSAAILAVWAPSEAIVAKKPMKRKVLDCIVGITRGDASSNEAQ